MVKATTSSVAALQPCTLCKGTGQVRTDVFDKIKEAISMGDSNIPNPKFNPWTGEPLQPGTAIPGGVLEQLSAGIGQEMAKEIEAPNGGFLKLLGDSAKELGAGVIQTGKQEVCLAAAQKMIEFGKTRLQDRYPIIGMVDLLGPLGNAALAAGIALGLKAAIQSNRASIPDIMQPKLLEAFASNAFEGAKIMVGREVVTAAKPMAADLIQVAAGSAVSALGGEMKQEKLVDGMKDITPEEFLGTKDDDA